MIFTPERLIDPSCGMFLAPIGPNDRLLSGFAMSALPSSARLAKAAIGVLCGLRPHFHLARRSGTERVATRSALGLRTLEVSARSAVVGTPPELSKPASGILVLGLEIEALLSHGQPFGSGIHKAFA